MARGTWIIFWEVVQMKRAFVAFMVFCFCGFLGCADTTDQQIQQFSKVTDKLRDMGFRGKFDFRNGPVVIGFLEAVYIDSGVKVTVDGSVDSSRQAADVNKRVSE